MPVESFRRKWDNASGCEEDAKHITVSRELDFVRLRRDPSEHVSCTADEVRVPRVELLSYRVEYGLCISMMA